MPAAAVIPAPIAYIKVVAVKKLVVECLGTARWPRIVRHAVCVPFPAGKRPVSVSWTCSITVRKSECLKQACPLEYISME